MEITAPENKNFVAWATQTYSTRKEAVNFLENSSDPFEKALGTLIKRYAGCERHDA